MQNNKVYSLLGIAAKAGKVVSGEFSVENSIRAGKAFMVIISEDASDNTKKLFNNRCFYYKVPLYFISDRFSLGNAIGKQMRVSLAVVDQGLSEAIMKQLNKAE